MKKWPNLMRHVMTTVLASVAALGVFMAHTALTAGGSGTREPETTVAPDATPKSGEAAAKNIAVVSDSGSDNDSASATFSADASAQDSGSATDGDKKDGEAEKPLPIPTRFEVDQTILEYQAASAEFRECLTLKVVRRETPVWESYLPNGEWVGSSRKSKVTDDSFREMNAAGIARTANARKLMAYSAQLRARRAQLAPQLAAAMSDDAPRSEADFERMGIIAIKREYDALGHRLRVIIAALNAEAELDRTIPPPEKKE